MKYVSVFFIGLLFSFGLIVSGMINPVKVIGFLDVSGEWDASLAFVMIGAVLVTSIGYQLLFKKQKPLFASGFSRTVKVKLDTRLFLGSAMFGVGWGLVGLCPGPAFAALSASPSSVFLFVVAMFAGMYLARILWRGAPRIVNKDSDLKARSVL